MKRYLMAALLALIALASRDALACEAGETTYLCSMDCVPLDSDTPAWAEVNVCATSEPAALGLAPWQLGQQWGCFPNDSDPSTPDTLDTLHCGACYPGEPCHPQGGLLGDGTLAPKPVNQGGLLGDLAEIGGEISCLFSSKYAPECTNEPLPCGDGCRWTCTSKAFGWYDGPFPQFYDVSGGFFYNDCDLGWWRVIPTMHEIWELQYPYLVVAPVFTQCSSGTPAHRECDGPPEYEEGREMCLFHCTGETMPQPYRLPSQGDTEVLVPCPDDFIDILDPLSEVNQQAKYTAEQIWLTWLGGMPAWAGLLVNTEKTRCSLGSEAQPRKTEWRCTGEKDQRYHPLEAGMPCTPNPITVIANAGSHYSAETEAGLAWYRNGGQNCQNIQCTEMTN